MKKLLLIFTLFTGMLCFSCSSDDDNHEEGVMLIDQAPNLITTFDICLVDSQGNAVMNDSNYVNPYIVKVAYKYSGQEQWSPNNYVPPFGDGIQQRIYAYSVLSVIPEEDKLKACVRFMSAEDRDSLSLDILLQWGNERYDTLTVVTKYWIEAMDKDGPEGPCYQHNDLLYLNGKRTESPIRIILEKIER